MEGLGISPTFFTGHMMTFLLIAGVMMWLMAAVAIGIFMTWKNTRRHEKRKRDEMRSDNFQ